MTLRRTLLLPLVPVYAAALATRRGVHRAFPGRTRALQNAVISVGSISAGGAGKTPFVLCLAGILARRDYAVRILSRGYGRDAPAVAPVERVDPAGNAARFGDEPLLLARRSGVPVYVGADRYQAGLMAEAAGASVDPDADPKMIVHLLDDGFQHRGLARDIDLVLLTREDVDDVLLPAGNLREPLTSLRRANILIVRDEEAASLQEVLSALHDTAVQDGHAPPRVWRIRRSLDLPSPELRAHPQRPLLFCGIARPAGFVTMLKAQGVRPAATVFFPDHHHYVERDMERLLAEADAHKADGFVTTEKDAVKLSPAMRRSLERIGPLLVPELRVDLIDEREAMEQLIAMVTRLDRRRRR